MRWTQTNQTRTTWLRFVGIGAILTLLIVAFLLFSDRLSTSATKYILKTADKSPLECPSAVSNITQWEFHTQRDANDHGLSDEQCRVAFPKLFVELDKSAEGRKEKKIMFQEVNGVSVEDGMVRAVVQDGELYIVDFGAMPATFTRGKATLNSLHRALASFPDSRNLPNIEFVLTTEDYSTGDGPIWSYSKKDEDTNVWLMPDFGYWSWPEVKIGSYKDIRARIASVDDGDSSSPNAQHGLSFQSKKKQLVWRGSVATNPQLRGKLLKAAQGKSWASIRVIDWDDENDLQYNLLPMEEHCRYMFLAHAEGRSFSGRGKYLLNCRSVTIAHQLAWKEVHHAALIASGPEANYVQVQNDFSDLERKVEFLIDNPETAQRIAENAVRTFRDRYLTPAAESCYWRELIRRYADSCEFEPVLFGMMEDGRKEARGTPFETWVLTG
ncbi:hypothetical protein N8T08_008187 [Aspergillus melleus]|uniref:Uncharacterized protein n=1 Tax=Aspergillus melleus TaxID=138277 RepID=A0ACC3AW83_9EURO|nr:hypothetical protein N8T08_008187 [Aspergillus melleus]